MAVLPWGHSRTHTTSTDKSKHTPRDWFSRNTSEPSRQALSELMKEHSRNHSGGSNSIKSGSRTNTSHSHRSQHSHHSHHSQHCSAKSEASDGRLSKVSGGRPSVPSRPASPAHSTVSALDHPESSNRSRFPRSEALKRMSSKLSLSSDSASYIGDIMISPPRFTASRIGFRRKESAISPGRESRPSISKPFDFQHVTHTEQAQFNELGKIDDSDFASQFATLQFGQELDTQLRGIRASDLGVVTPPRPVDQSPMSPPRSPEHETIRPSTPSLTKTMDLPMTPPRPTPPPKELLPITPLNTADIRMSRSMENFSRPTTRSPTSHVNISPLRSMASQTRLAAAASIVDSRATTPDISYAKPLPLLPPVGHAVSTQDQTARCLISAPLPSPPAYVTEHNHRSSHRRQSSSKGSLRHMSTFPSSRYPTLLEGQLRGIQEEAEPLPRHRSDNALSRHLARPDSKTSSNSSRVSAANNLVTEDWEDAVDFAWDHDDMDDVDESLAHGRAMTLHPSGSQGSLLMVQQPTYDRSSVVSTPQMTMASGNDTFAATSIDNSNSQLLGLGIGSPDDKTTSKKFTQPPLLQVSVPDSASFSMSQHLPRTTYSALSKSSSQESIILSIASSIMGTQRSSNSSVGPGELMHWSKIDDTPSAMTANSSPLLSSGSLKPARPESTCVPAALLKGFATADSAGTSEQSEDFGTSSIPVPTSNEAEDCVTPLPSQQRQLKATSSSSIPVPDRTSSIPASTSKQVRQRASTISSIRRPVRASYSLFPNATPSTAA